MLGFWLEAASGIALLFSRSYPTYYFTIVVTFLLISREILAQFTSVLVYALALDACSWKINRAFAAFQLLELRDDKVSLHFYKFTVTPFYLTTALAEEASRLKTGTAPLQRPSGNGHSSNSGEMAGKATKFRSCISLPFRGRFRLSCSWCCNAYSVAYVLAIPACFQVQWLNGMPMLW